MHNKTGRNDPCPCGSGKKYKQCCMQKPKATATSMMGLKKKISAKLISQPKPIDLMERTFGPAIASIEQQEQRPSEAEHKPPENAPSE